jgi:hypothetical protein
VSNTVTVLAGAIDAAGNRSAIESADFTFSSAFRTDFEGENLGG